MLSDVGDLARMRYGVRKLAELVQQPAIVGIEEHICTTDRCAVCVLTKCGIGAALAHSPTCECVPHRVL